MADINLNLGITNPIPLRIELTPITLGIALTPVDVNFSIGGGSPAISLGVTNPIPLSVNLSPIDTTFVLNPINVNFSIGGGGGTGSGTVTAISAGIGLGAPLTGNTITTTGTIRLLAPTATVIGGVKAGTNITIALDGTISSTGGVTRLDGLVDVSIVEPSYVDSTLVIASFTATEITTTAAVGTNVIVGDFIRGTNTPANAPLARITAVLGSTITVASTVGFGFANALSIYKASATTIDGQMLTYDLATNKWIARTSSGGVSPATATPGASGVGAVGTSLLYARGDHIHPLALTTTGTVGPSTYSNVTGALNIPNYTFPTTLQGLSDVFIVEPTYVDSTLIISSFTSTIITTTLAVGTNLVVGDFIRGTNTPVNSPFVKVMAISGFEITVASTVGFGFADAGNIYKASSIAIDGQALVFDIATNKWISRTIVAGPLPATDTPKASGVGAVGTSLLYARGDHVHPLALTTTGNSGASTYSAVTGALNIPQYSGTTTLQGLTDVMVTEPTYVDTTLIIDSFTATVITTTVPVGALVVVGDFIRGTNMPANSPFAKVSAISGSTITVASTVGFGFAIAGSIYKANAITIDGAALVFDIATNKWIARSGGGGVSPGNAVPKASGVGAPGVSLLYSRQDHVHPLTVTSLGTTGGSTYNAATGALNIPTYSGGGGGGAAGVSWISAANISVGDIFLGYTYADVLPGATRVFTNTAPIVNLNIVTGVISREGANGGAIPKEANSATNPATGLMLGQLAQNTGVTSQRFGIFSTFNGFEFTYATAPVQTNQIVSEIYWFGGANRFVILSLFSNPPTVETTYVTTTTDGETFTQVPIPSSVSTLNQWGVGAVVGDNLYIAARQSVTNIILTTTDLVTWTPVTMASTTQWVFIRPLKGANSNRVVAYGFNYVSNVQIRYTNISNDSGATWSVGATPPQDFQDIFTSPTQVVAVYIFSGPGTYTYYVSDDFGATWSAAKIFPLGPSVVSMRWTGSYWLISYIGVSTIYKATNISDPSTWTLVTYENYVTAFNSQAIYYNTVNEFLVFWTNTVGTGTQYVYYADNIDAIRVTSSNASALQTSPAGTYRCLGGTQTVGDTTAFWTRTV